MRPSTIISPLLLVATTVTALGINCRGSAFCDLGEAGGKLNQLIKKVERLPDGKKTKPGAHIACVGHLCAFTENWDKPIGKKRALEKLNDLA